MKTQEEIQCREQLKTLQLNMINICLELNNLLRLSKRLSYFCPIEHVSEPFFILYAENKGRVAEVREALIQLLKLDHQIISDQGSKDLLDAQSS